MLGQQRISKCLNTLVVALLLLFSQHNFAGTYGGGLGSAGEPYIVADPNHMQEIGATEADWDKHFVITANIDLSVYTGEDFDIIGNLTTPFTGVFDGNNFTISNFTYISPYQDFTGIFGYVGATGQVINLGVTNVNIDAGTGWYAGTIAGANDGVITNCYAKGDIAGYGEVGGLVGNSIGTISNCYTEGTVTGVYDGIGGLVGATEEMGSVYDSYSMANVTGESDCGGLVGSHWGDTISRCFATGDVDSYEEAGGLVGWNFFGTITNCYATGNANAGYYSGGFAGYNDGYIGYCYSLGSSGGGYDDGGFVGGSSNTIYESNFWNIDVNPNRDGIGTSWWNEDPNGITGKTGEELRALSTYADAGWDLVGETANGTDDIWKLDTCGYPVLSWVPVVTVPDLIGMDQAVAADALNSAGLVLGEVTIVRNMSVPTGEIFDQSIHGGCQTVTGVMIDITVAFKPYEGGTGTPEDPFQVAVANQIDELGSYPDDWDKSFILTANIDMSGYSYTKAVIAWNSTASSTFSGTQFTGIFDGNGHSIANLSIDASETNYCYVGLFGYTLNGSIIQNLQLDSINVTGPANYTGGMVAFSNNSYIYNCCVTSGTVTGNSYAGVMVGSLLRSEVVNCYSLASASGNYSGGLIGVNSYGNVQNCFSAGEVTGSNAGAFAGENHNGTFGYCFWNSEINSGLSGLGSGSSSEVMGKTTLELQTQSTFTDHGWDFVGEDVNGTDDIWRLCVDGVNYPKLRHEHDSIGDFSCPDGVALEDLVYLAISWLGTDERADLSGDGEVTLIDFAKFAEHWMEGI